MTQVTADELHVLDHATAWRRGRYRNYFTAGRDSDSWPALVSLAAKGLMTQSRPNNDLGGMVIFRVTGDGFAFLQKALP